MKKPCEAEKPNDALFVSKLDKKSVKRHYCNKVGIMLMIVTRRKTT